MAEREVGHGRRRASPPRPKAHLGLDEIRGVVTAFPGVVEEDRSARRGRTAIHWLARKTMFAKYGEASNLTEPDVVDTLMIRRCPDRPGLLASAPLRSS